MPIGPDEEGPKLDEQNFPTIKSFVSSSEFQSLSKAYKSYYNNFEKECVKIAKNKNKFVDFIKNK